MGWRRFLRRSRWDDERAREIEAHLAMEEDYQAARGVPRNEARAAALRKFGNPSRIREEIYAMNTIGWLDTLGQDIRYALRVLRANRGSPPWRSFRSRSASAQTAPCSSW
jgi:hypothetical protein